MDELRGLIIPVLIGALVGFERQKAHQGQETTLGLRTFILLSLLGALAAWTELTWIRVALFLFGLILILLSYWGTMRRKQHQADLGLTTELAAAVVFFLGYASSHRPMTSALLGCFVALVLFLKGPLHRFSKKVTSSELQAAILLGLIGFGVVSLLPDHTIDPWDLFNPRKFGIIVLALGLIEFAGYIGIKLFGDRKGSLLTGLLGGLVSSTAVMLESAKKCRTKPASWKAFSSTVLAAQFSSIVEVIIIVGAVSLGLALELLPLIISSSCIVLIGLTWCHYKQKNTQNLLQLQSPLDLKSILQLGTLLALILVGINAASKWIGKIGAQAVSFLSGFFELHGLSFANASSYAEGQIEIADAVISIYLALIASFMAKIGLAWGIARGKFAVFISIVLVISAATGGVFVYIFI